MNQTYLSLSRPQTISAPKTFEGTLQITNSGSLQSDYNITLEGYINGVDLELLEARVFLSGIGQTVNGIKTFAINVTFEGMYCICYAGKCLSHYRFTHLSFIIR